MLERTKHMKREIKERRQSEESLRQERNSLIGILESMKDGVYIVNQQYDIDYINPSLIKHFGPYEGKKCYDYFHDGKEVCSWCKNQDVFAGKTVRWEWYSFKNQRTYDLIDTPLRNPDGSISKLEIFRDITDLKQTQKLLQMKKHDLGERVKELNCLFEISKLLQKPDISIEEILQGTIDLITTSWQYPEITCARIVLDGLLIKTNNFKETVWKQSSDIIMHGDRAGTIDIFYLEERPEIDDGPFLKEERSLIRIIAEELGRIIERKQVEEDLDKSRNQLYQAQKMESLGTLVAGVAHEINNPINLIMFNIPLLQKIWNDFQPILEEAAVKKPDRKYGGLTCNFLQENYSQLLSDMNMAVGRVAKIINDLKNFARQSTISDKKVISINEAVENALRLAQISIRESEVKLKYKLEHNLPLMEGNLQSIEQVVLNLIINAIQAVEHDRGEIKIITGSQNRGEGIFISVSDNGPGIDPSISDRIFDPFFTSKQAGDGIGLGLAITYNLVRAHGGNITFESEKGKGTTFTVLFPTTMKKGTAKILVVDDDEMIRNMLTKALTVNRTYSVEEASNGLETCIKLGTYRPDLLILDVVMPEMDGLEVCRVIKKEPELSDMKVIVTTGFADHPKVKEINEIGFTDVYSKPIEIPDFLELVDEVLKVDKVQG